MATIFPTSPAPQINDEYQGYRYNGTSWDIIGVDLTGDYQTRVASVSNTELGYLDGVTSAIQTQLNSKPTMTAGVISDANISENIARVSDISNSTTGYIAVTQKGVADGVASLDGEGKVPSTQLNLTDYALLASPTFTGTVTIPAGASISGYATETYVGTAVSNLVDAAPATLNTLNELAAALGDDPSYATTITTALGTKAPLASPTFTGTVTVPTLNLTNALGYAYGGTGMSSIGGANSILTVNSAGTALQYTNTLTINSITTGEAITKTTSTALTSSTVTTIGTFPVPSGNCIAVECVVLISSTSNGSYTASKLLITADPDFNAVADITEYAVMKNNDFDLFPIFTATLSGSNVLLRVSATGASNATAKVISTSILSPHGAA
jgi:hypothetical protein